MTGAPFHVENWTTVRGVDRLLIDGRCVAELFPVPDASGAVLHWRGGLTAHSWPVVAGTREAGRQVLADAYRGVTR